MYEFGLTHLATGKQTVIFGFDVNSAFKRSKLNPAEYVVNYREYVD